MWRRSRANLPRMMRVHLLLPMLRPHSAFWRRTCEPSGQRRQPMHVSKKRIVRTLIHEVVADIDDAASEIVLIVHWVGGAHSELRLPKRRRGQRNSTSLPISSKPCVSRC
jgi:hypothetical protein